MTSSRRLTRREVERIRKSALIGSQRGGSVVYATVSEADFAALCQTALDALEDSARLDELEQLISDGEDCRSVEFRYYDPKHGYNVEQSYYAIDANDKEYGGHWSGNDETGPTLRLAISAMLYEYRLRRAAADSPTERSA